MCRLSNWDSEYRRVRRTDDEKDSVQDDLEKEWNKSSEKFAADGKEEKTEQVNNVQDELELVLHFSAA